MSPPVAQPQRGQIWYARFPGDPAGKNPRPALIVSLDSRNTHPRANTVLAVPLSTTLTDSTLHIRLQPGETGLPEIRELQPENISVITKDSLAPTPHTRMLGHRILRMVAANVVRSMGIQPRDLQD
jgi:mRNA-degrading endonuclease toxin of MazEF toxin-antitoxin module